MATTQVSRCGGIVGHVQWSAAMLTRQGSHVGGVATIAITTAEHKVSHLNTTRAEVTGILIRVHASKTRADYTTRWAKFTQKYKCHAGSPRSFAATFGLWSLCPFHFRRSHATESAARPSLRVDGPKRRSAEASCQTVNRRCGLSMFCRRLPRPWRWLLKGRLRQLLRLRAGHVAPLWPCGSARSFRRCDRTARSGP